MDHLHPVDALEAEAARRSEDPHPDAVGGGKPRALGERLEALLSAVAVEGNGDAAPGGHGYSESEPVAGASATRWETTSRPA